ncbi:MAG: TRZ/ATZ family hydrolase [Betaproteobacteria bacterium]|nr:TRZ/ATZ family hydrolase [Betaproteobacteria bacterium]
MTAPDLVDSLIDARWVIPVEPDRRVLADHSVAVRAGRIVAIVPTAEVGERFRAGRRFTLSRHALIPGLINLHTHAAMTLMRGLADDLDATSWMRNCIAPAEAKHLSPEFVHDGTMLACAEMLRGGVTCFNDMYFFPGSAASAAIACGMRAAIGIIISDSATQYATDPDDYLAKGLAVRDEHRGNPLLSFCMAPHRTDRLADKTIERILTIAEELDLQIHLHLHETRTEIDASLSRHKVRPLERLSTLGVADARLIAANAVHVSPDELDLLARFGCSVAHCPSSNLKLASGLAPVAQMLARSINLGLGTDGAASNNRLDVFQEMRAAALLAKGLSGDAEAMPAHAALRAATLGGAQALGLGSETGSIAIGKAADLCAVSFEGPGFWPCYDPISHLAYVAGRENVSHVWIAGRLAVESHELVDFEAGTLDKLALLWQNKLATES